MIATMIGSIGGMLMGATGGVGAIAIVPLTMFGLGLSIHQSIVFSIVLVGVTALFGLLPRQRWRVLNWQVAFWVALGGVLSVPLGAQLSFALSEMTLVSAFSLLMLVVALFAFWQTRQLRKTEASSVHHQPPLQLETIQRQWPLLFFVGISAGFLSGLFGIGSGFVLVPVLVYGLGMAVTHAVGTSLLIIVPLALAGSVSHLHHILVDRMLLLWFLVGSTCGMWLGAFVPRSSWREPVLQFFALMLSCVALALLACVFHASGVSS